MLGFSKDELCNKLLDGITLLRVIPGVTWTQPIYMCVCVCVCVCVAKLYEFWMDPITFRVLPSTKMI